VPGVQEMVPLAMFTNSIRMFVNAGDGEEWQMFQVSEAPGSRSLCVIQACLGLPTSTVSEQYL
jgi:hypothetical protein